jgi:hypothetical protein
VVREPALRRSLARHARSVEQALAWFQCATAIKARDPVGMLSSCGRNPRNLLHVGREAIRAVPRAWAKRAARGAA